MRQLVLDEFGCRARMCADVTRDTGVQ